MRLFLEVTKRSFQRHLTYRAAALEGKLLYDGDLSALKARFGGQRRLRVEFAQKYPDPCIDGAEIIKRDGRWIAYGFERGALSASTLIGRLSDRFRLRDLEVLEPEIEETIRRIYEERLLDTKTPKFDKLGMSSKAPSVVQFQRLPVKL